MKVVVNLTINVDPEKWEMVSGCDRDEVRESIKRYLLNVAQNTAMIEESDAEVTLK